MQTMCSVPKRFSIPILHVRCKQPSTSHPFLASIQVMGRHCGYLALVAGVVCEADFVFIPEWPPETDWKSRMCTKLKAARDDAGQRLNIIIVAEGAIDRNGDKISCEEVKRAVVEELKQV